MDFSSREGRVRMMATKANAVATPDIMIRLYQYSTDTKRAKFATPNSMKHEIPIATITTVISSGRKYFPSLLVSVSSRFDLETKISNNNDVHAASHRTTVVRAVSGLWIRMPIAINQ